MDSSGEIIEVWDKAQLMAKNAEAAEAAEGKDKKQKDLDQLMLWGQPGHLTEEEADIYVSFNWTLALWMDMLLAFGLCEVECYVLCAM